jgi:hypothetical protein
MANMSYCRFENTARDLRDCRDALDDGVTPAELSQDEATACRRLIRICEEIADRYGDLVDDEEA